MKPELGCRVVSGKMQIVTAKLGKITPVANFDAIGISTFVSMVLAQAGDANDKIESGTKANQAAVVPTGFGLVGSEPNRPTLLTIHFGKVVLSVAVPDPKPLGEALIAASVGRKTTN